MSSCRRAPIFTGRKPTVYRPETHRLEKVVQGDMRAATGTQEFAATAPLNLVYVVDQSKQPGDFDARRKLVTACTDAGFIGENVYLFCASEGLGTVFRAMINANYIQQCLKLPRPQKSPVRPECRLSVKILKKHAPERYDTRHPGDGRSHCLRNSRDGNRRSH